MSTTAVNELESATKYLTESHFATKNAAASLERVSPRLAEEATIALKIIEETRDGVRTALYALEHA